MSRFGGLDRIAGCSVVGATGVGTVADGCATARTGAGVYTVTLDTPVAASDAIMLATLTSGIAGMVTIAHTSASVKTVSTWSAAGAAADRDFDFAIFREI